MANEKRTVSATMALVSLRWNGEPLATRVARPGEPVVLGEARGALAPLPQEALGCAAWTIADADGGPHACIPEGKVASITGPAGLRLCAGPERIALAADEEATVLFGAFAVTIAALAEERAAPRQRRVAAGAWLPTAVVAAVHGALLFAGQRAAFAAQLEPESGPDLDRLRGYLAAAEERSATPDPLQFAMNGQGDSKRANNESGNGKDGGGERHKGATGAAGATASRLKNQHFGAAPREEKGNGARSADDLDAVRSFGMIGLLAANEAAALQRADATSPWGANDPFEAAGGMLGRAVGESMGSVGLALSGIGEGGGGSGEGIGLGTIGTIGHTRGRAGLGTGGIGSPGMIGLGRISTWSHDWTSRDHTARLWSRPPYLCYDGVSGRLPAEAIQRIVRQNFGRFRGCYESGLKRDPALAGRVTTSFTIGRDGAVMSAADGGSDLPDAGVKACVVRSFYGISFPQPEGGIVSVTYPIVFSKTE